MLFDPSKLNGDIKGLSADFNSLGHDCHCWSAGYCFVGDEPCLGERLSSEILDRTKRHALADLNGCFASVLVSHEGHRLEINLISDRYGTKPLYYAAVNDNLLVGDDYWAMVASLNKATLSLKSAIDYMAFSYVLGKDTIIEQIKEVPPASVIEFEYDLQTSKIVKVTADNYWKYDIKPEGLDREDLIDGLLSVYEGMARRYTNLFHAMNVRKIGINLSAGKDSRLITWMLHQNDFALHFYTNRSVNQDLHTAIEISQVLEAPHTITSLWHLYLDEPEDGIFWSLCPTTMFTVSNNAMSLKASGCCGDDAILSGHLGDFFSGGHLPLQGVLNVKRITRQEVADIALKKNLAVSPDMMRMIVKPQHHDQLDSIKARYRDLIYNARVTTDLASLTQVDLEQRQRRLLFRDVTSLSFMGISVMPFSDMEYSRFFSKVPFEWMLYSRLVTSAMAARLLTGRYRSIFTIPVNGRRVRLSKHPLAAGSAEFLVGMIGSRLRRFLNPGMLDGKSRKGTVSDRNYIKTDILMKNIEYLEWLVDVDSLRRYVCARENNPHFILYQFWVLYSLARIARRLS